jgi:hypothetical protein
MEKKTQLLLGLSTDNVDALFESISASELNMDDILLDRETTFRKKYNINETTDIIPLLEDNQFIKIEKTPEYVLAGYNSQKDYDSDEYARLRKVEYDLLNQDEMRFDDMENGTNTWGAAINAIKDKYPKPEEK